jgi:hypothetical protein
MDVLKEINLEEWLTIDGFSSYQVSSSGRVRNIKRKKILKLSKNWNNYIVVTIRGDLNNKKQFRVHRLVATYFIENKHNKPTVNHKDGDKSNNSVSNLEWMTHKEQQIHAVENNLVNHSKGEDHYKSTISNQDVIAIREMYKTQRFTMSEIGGLFKLSGSTVQAIISNKTYKSILNEVI